MSGRSVPSTLIANGRAMVAPAMGKVKSEAEEEEEEEVVEEEEEERGGG